MTRAFRSDPIASSVVDSLIDVARRGPSAGNAGSPDFLVLEGAQVAEYWDVALSVDKRAEFPWPQLLVAPVLIVAWVDPQRYVDRYSETDKAHTGLGEAQSDWSVPYWFVDGGAAVMSLLLAAEEVGLGALLFGLFEHEDAVRKRFSVPQGRRAVGVVALGHRAADRPSTSAKRGLRPLTEVTHRGTW